MTALIPFIRSSKDFSILADVYKDSQVIRIDLPTMSHVDMANERKDFNIWFDSGFDGYAAGRITKGENRGKLSVSRYFEGYGDYEMLGEPRFVDAPDRSRLSDFVFTILGECLQINPSSVSVPQFPATGQTNKNDKSVETVNKLLAEITSEWAESSDYSGKLILPLILTHEAQSKYKTVARAIIKQALTCIDKSQAEMIWVVDQSLADYRGAKRFRERFEKLITFHEMLKNQRPTLKVIAGPYWGMGIVLWARGLIDFFAVGMGGGYQYRSPAIFPKWGRHSMSIGPIRRCAVIEDALYDWLNKDVLSKMPSNDPTYEEFARLRDSFAMFQDKDVCKRETARFYRKWYDSIESVSPSGRKLALFRDLSSAFVLGSSLPNLPSGNTPVKPARVVEMLMLNCV